MRSSAKPFQAMALILTGAAGALNLTDRDLAIACSSHPASQNMSPLSPSSWKREMFHHQACAVASTLHWMLPRANAFRLEGDSPTALHNNCSGKRAACFWCAGIWVGPSRAIKTRATLSRN